jgi:hypothetical protein
MITTRQQWQNFDFPLFAAVLFLSIFGVALISSAIAGNPTLANHPQRQTVFLIIGLAALFIFAGLDYKIWLVLTRPFYIVVAAFLILVFVTARPGLAQHAGLQSARRLSSRRNWRKSLLLWRWRNSSPVKLPTSMNGRPSARACCDGGI